MNDPNLNQLLKWSIRNSEVSRKDPSSQSDPKAKRDPERGLNAEALSHLMGGPSDADRMREAMTAIVSADVDLDNKMIAFDNFEQLIENIDNANNMEHLRLWMPLTQQLDSREPKLRMMAAWCISTAIQNNPRGQERVSKIRRMVSISSDSDCMIVQVLILGAIPRLVDIALHDIDPSTRKKAAGVLSSASRNYQAGLDAVLKELPRDYQPDDGVDTGNMEAVDAVIDKLRAQTGTNNT